MNVEEVTLEPVEDLAEAREVWELLDSESGSVFTSWEWASVWWRHFGGDGELRLRACLDSRGGRFALLPLYLWRRRPLRVLRFLGHGPADELEPVCPPGHEKAAARMLRAALTTENADAVVAEVLPGRRRWPRLVEGTTVGRDASPRLLAPNGWDAYLESRSANLREQVRARDRRLERSFKVRRRLVHEPAELDEAFDTLLRLHTARWGERSGFGHASFHREFARLALTRGWLRLWLLELDGRPAAAWYGFRRGGVESYYQAGRDPSYDRYAVGFVLLAHTIRASLQEGVSEYRFLRGAEPFKYRFADEDPGLETVALTRGRVSGWALRTYLQARRVLRHPA